MKKIQNKKSLGIIFIVFGIILLIVLGNPIFNKRKEHITKYLDIKIDNCKVDSEKDTHDGFLGDGDYFVKLNCTEKQDNDIKSKWIKLPLSEEIQKSLSIINCDGNGCISFLEKYNILNITNGYYNFYDRYSEAKDRKSDSELNNRSSYNFSIGIYDSDTKIIYFYELDT